MAEHVYSNVIEKDGGPYSLYCTSCHRWIPNTANAEMIKESCFSHSHFCCDGINLTDNDGGIPADAVDGLVGKEDHNGKRQREAPVPLYAGRN